MFSKEKEFSMNVEASREPERYTMVWPGMPTGLNKDQAKNFFLEHKKPKSYILERFTYNPITGHFQTFGYDR